MINPLGKPAGIGLVALGAILLVLNTFSGDLFTLSMHWSFFIMIPGALVMALGMMTGDQTRALATLGMATLVTGAVLGYQDLANHFQSWAYAWILTGPVAAGAAWWLFGIVHDDPAAIADGRPLVFFGLLAFLAAAAVFELVIGISGYGILSNLTLGLVAGLTLIVAGLAVVFRPGDGTRPVERMDNPEVLDSE
ncbi:hypothetical protein [Tropicimonas marinistellae]|uniref:hypothetical protein n=1 Tax=Tropicimonas marinistellae TaxID=1739787 RepID=UPI00083562EE|nr:hypothetical protein [Tropicimonas marinistellae]